MEGDEKVVNRRETTKIAPTARPVVPEQKIGADDEKVDEAGRESFPASDPPAWTSGVEPGRSS